MALARANWPPADQGGEPRREGPDNRRYRQHRLPDAPHRGRRAARAASAGAAGPGTGPADPV